MKIFRGNLWWSTIIPQVLGWLYFCLLIIYPFPHTYTTAKFSLFFASLVLFAAFGYALNDFFDREVDTLAGKENLLSKYSKKAALFFVLVPFVLGSISWYFFNAGIWANVFLVLQVLALMAYSIPPFRLKSTGALGVLADAFYAHINPVFIVLSSFGFFLGDAKWKFTFLIFLFPVIFLKGLRNILLHQIQDRKLDAKSEGGTLVNRLGGVYSLHLINKLLGVEIVFSALLLAVICFMLPPVIIFVIGFMVISYLKFSGWKLAYLPARQLKFKFLYFMNDLYECWLPLAFLMLLSIRDIRFVALLLLHHILFPGFVVKLIADLKKIRENFKTEEVY